MIQVGGVDSRRVGSSLLHTATADNGKGAEECGRCPGHDVMVSLFVVSDIHNTRVSHHLSWVLFSDASEQHDWFSKSRISCRRLMNASDGIIETLDACSLGKCSGVRRRPRARPVQRSVYT